MFTIVVMGFQNCGKLANTGAFATSASQDNPGPQNGISTASVVATSNFFGPSGGSVTIASPSTTASGNYLFVAILVDGAPMTLTVPNGWTLLGSPEPDPSGEATLYSYGKFASAADAGGGGTYTWSWSTSAYSSGVIYALTGTSGPDNHSGLSGSSSSGPLVSNSMVTNHGNELLIAIFHVNAVGAITVGAPLIQDFSSTSLDLGGGHVLLTNAGNTGTFTATTNATSVTGWQSVIFSFISN